MIEYSIQKLLKRNWELFGEDPYLYEKIDGSYAAHTHREFIRDVYRFAGYLQAQGLMHKKVAVFAKNSYAYMVADMAIMGFVGICATLSKSWGLYDVGNAAGFLELDALLYSADKTDIIAELKAQYPDIQYIPIEQVYTVGDYPLEEDQISVEDCCKIIFSSGTTGMAKAVMLSQKNMFANWENLYRRVPMNHEDICYLFLPMYHTYAGIANCLYSLISGMSIYLCSIPDQMFAEIQAVKPTIFCAVPLIYEKLYALCTENQWDPRTILGGKSKFLFTGGVRLKQEIRRYFKTRGLFLCDAYGLTETSSLVSVEYPNTTDFDSSGTIFENIDVKIDAPDENGVGEILVKGENITIGYYRNETLNQKVFDENGYFRTGDLGYVQHGKIYITGRKKRVIICSNGENIYPDEIEELFREYQTIQRVKVYKKDDMLFASLLVTKDDDVDVIVKTVNKKLPGFSKIKSYDIQFYQMDTMVK
ncbi:MAG: AMP-binding protein [Oscillospiraceae bacterium]|nr:AMP-binding protein [Oscillospiraceae bacterium]